MAILIRPVREQFEHDRVIRALEALGFRLVREREHIAMARTNADGSQTPLTLPNHAPLSAHEGMRPSLEGTQASGAGESHAQEANVAEVSYGKPVTVEP